MWANGERVGTWSVAQGEHRLQYDEGWTTSPSGRPLSLSLPFTPANTQHRGSAVRNYFDNLLPDSDPIRRRMAQRFALQDTDTFTLLGAAGRDCVGAVQLLAPGDVPRGVDRIDAVPLDSAGVERAIETALSPGRVLGQDAADGFRISLAGAQEKTALLNWQGKWCLPLGSTPTTHIVKLPLGLVGNMRANMHDSVENEWLCTQLLARLGFAVAPCSIRRFGGRKALMVERFDRALQMPAGRAPWIARLPQEDFCQALGVPGTQKYESDGGPGVRDVLRILDNSSNAQGDKLTFVKTLLAFWLMAATDGHAKNFSIFLERGGRYRLTPLYDVLSTWPIIGDGPSQISPRRAKLAMALRATNTHYHLREIRTRHWADLAARSGVPDAFDHMVAIVLQVPAVLEDMQAQLPDGFPSPVFFAIRDGMLAQAEAFVAAL
ncbi:type II toxin-antitoxin system HipA family toxin [Ramlibacter albus]|uniref:type II toxin-antitoxin system HipA family toxin n=1 Tax=Ramlibacter albus TaxID=2079448 RepID=UPI00338D87DA